MNPCPALAFRSTRDFLQAVVQQRRPGAQIVAYRDSSGDTVRSSIHGGERVLRHRSVQTARIVLACP